MSLLVNQRAMRARGFTLVEVIVGMVVFALALGVLTSLFWSQSTRSIEAGFQIRAAELGQGLVDEILGKRFDEATPVGGVPPCTASCSTVSGPEGESRADFDDVDDYQVYCGDDGSGLPGWPVSDALGAELTDPDFTRFRMRVCVNYDGDYNNSYDSDTRAKLIEVDIYPQTAGGVGSPIRFSVYKGNY